MRRMWMALAAALLSIGHPAQAAELRMIVPFAAGGPTDQVARIIAPELRKALDRTVIVENKGGAGGIVGTRAVAAAAPNGDTILLATMGSQVVAPLLGNTAGYHPSRSFDTLAMIGTIQIGLVVRPNLPAANLKELIELARSGTPLSYGSAGVGTTTHIAAEALNAQAGGKLVHVPYQGGAPAVTDLIGGHIDLYAGDIPTLASFIKAGSVRPVAVLDQERSALFPDIPTSAELGYPDIKMTNWYGFLAPHGLPAATRGRLEQALVAVLNQPEIQARLRELGVSGPKNAREFESIIVRDTERWGPFLKARNIAP